MEGRTAASLHEKSQNCSSSSIIHKLETLDTCIAHQSNALRSGSTDSDAARTPLPVLTQVLTPSLPPIPGSTHGPPRWNAALS